MGFDKNSEQLRIAGVVHRDKDGEGRTRIFFKAERAGGTELLGFASGNENTAKWCAVGKSFYGEIRGDQAIRDSKGNAYARVWRDWDRSPKKQGGVPMDGQGQAAQPVGVEVTLDQAIATYKAVEAIAGDPAVAGAVFAKLEIRVPYKAPEAQGEASPAGFTPESDDSIPF